MRQDCSNGIPPLYSQNYSRYGVKPYTINQSSLMVLESSKKIKIFKGHRRKKVIGRGHLSQMTLKKSSFFLIVQLEYKIFKDT